MKKTLLILSLLILTNCTKLPMDRYINSTPFKNYYSDKYPEPIELNKIIINIPQGSPVARYHLGFNCVGPIGDFTWTESRTSYNDQDLKDTFYERMNASGYNIIGDPNNLFEFNDNNNKRAKYLVGAQIKSIKSNLCHRTGFFGVPTGETGETEIEVLWQIYSVKNKELVYRKKTKGYFNISSPNHAAFVMLLNGAFEASVSELSRDKNFQKLIFAKDNSNYTKQKEAPFEKLNISKEKEFNINMSENSKRIKESTLLIRSGNGHGSGFIISTDGYILTNHHVVGNSSEVFVEDSFGRQVEAEVLRVHKGRDVALLKTKTKNLIYKPIPIRKKQAVSGEEVFAIGAPLEQKYKNTITKGIVSNIDNFEDDEYEYIQADVDIQGGNSGGPLVDKNGNIIGISVAGLTYGAGSIGINFFIPIHDALKHLDINIK